MPMPRRYVFLLCRRWLKVSCHIVRLILATSFYRQVVYLMRDYTPRSLPADRCRCHFGSVVGSAYHRLQ